MRSLKMNGLTSRWLVKKARGWGDIDIYIYIFQEYYTVCDSENRVKFSWDSGLDSAHDILPVLSKISVTCRELSYDMSIDLGTSRAANLCTAHKIIKNIYMELWAGLSGLNLYYSSNGPYFFIIILVANYFVGQDPFYIIWSSFFFNFNMVSQGPCSLVALSCSLIRGGCRLAREGFAY